MPFHNNSVVLLVVVVVIVNNSSKKEAWLDVCVCICVTACGSPYPMQWAHRNRISLKEALKRIEVLADYGHG